MACAFMGGMAVIALEVWLLFRAQWDLFEALLQENPILVFALFGCQLAIPMALAMIAGGKVGKRIGDEAETIARSLRP